MVTQADSLDACINEIFLEYAQARGIVNDPARACHARDKASLSAPSAAWVMTASPARRWHDARRLRAFKNTERRCCLRSGASWGIGFIVTPIRKVNRKQR